jgi:von Willebrand factor type A domain/Aerotolerance regulator N-terminal
MHVSNPIYFLLSLFIALVILFYFFRKQYEETPVSSNMLWKEVLNEWQASPWLKKLQQNLMFWLQILALIFVMFSLVRPFWYEDGLMGEHIVLIIDSSATMSAEDGTKSRFQRAKEKMKDLAGKLQGQEVTIIQAGQKPKIVLNKETDKKMIQKAIDRLELTYEHENMEKAISLAESISAENSHATAIHIFSDGVTKDHLKHIGKERYVEVHNFGKKLDNLSIASFGVANVEGKISGVAVIENQSEKPVKALFTVKGADRILFEQEVAIRTKDPFIVAIPELARSPFYEASIHVNDGYVVDNKVTSIYTDANPKVYALGEQNPFIIKGFETIGVDLIQTDEKDFGIDLNGILIVESSSLSELPAQPLIVFNNRKEKYSLTEVPKPNGDSLLEYVRPEGIYIAQAAKEMESGLETVLKSGEFPLIQKGMRNGQPLIVLNFSLADTDWPLQPGFPVFLYNCYQWLSQQTGFLGYFTPGEKKWLNASGSSRLEIYNEKGENIDSLDLKKESFNAPFHPGTYQAVADESIYYFSVLLDEREKTTQTASSFTLHEQHAKKDGEMKKPNDFLWFWFALIAFVLIAIEWEVFRRGFRG